MHCSAPRVELYEPALQGWHLELPVRLAKLPRSQSKQATPPGSLEYVPRVHGRQVPFVSDDPAGQGEQLSWPYNLGLPLGH